jgi:hypothetical protein
MDLTDEQWDVLKAIIPTPPGARMAGDAPGAIPGLS